MRTATLETICSACGEECQGTVVDFGIGAYEYWGAPGYDSQPCEVSECCEAEIVEGGSKMIRQTVHVARKDHGPTIKKGMKYVVTVTRHWRKDGPSWVTTHKRALAGV